MKKFQDNLPLDGEVHLKDDVRVYIYRGYRAGSTDDCAICVKGEANSKWVDRSLLTPVQTQTDRPIATYPVSEA